MKVTLISASDGGGGAARAAHRILDAFESASIDASMLVRDKTTSDATVAEVGGCWERVVGPCRSKTDRELGKLNHHSDHSFRSINVWPTRLAGRLQSDVVNLHWVGSGTMSVADIGRIRQPLVMTLHDMWGFAGAQHYADDGPTASWRRGNGDPMRRGGLFSGDLDEWTRNRKRKHWHRSHVVCPSRWLADCAATSAIMHDWRINVIPYPINLEVFSPGDKPAARAELGIRHDAVVILFGALDGSADPRKGFDLLVSAFADLHLPGSVECLVFGQDMPDEGHPLPVASKWTGHIDDDDRLARIYQAADLAVVPSRQDNLPQVAVEAQSCGLPVVAFDTGGLADAVENGTTGLLAPPFSVSELARSIQQLVEDSELRSTLGSEARSRACRLWDPAVVADSYVAVFRDALDARAREAVSK